MTDAVAVVLAFNEAINGRDLAALTELMTASHRFIDSAGATVDGTNACLEAWRGFFDSFPDYRNVFADVADVGDGVSSLCGVDPSAASLHSTDQPSGARWSSTLAWTCGRSRNQRRGCIEPAVADAGRRDYRARVGHLVSACCRARKRASGPAGDRHRRDRDAHLPSGASHAPSVRRGGLSVGPLGER